MIQFNFYFEGGGGGIKFKTNLKKKEKFPKSQNIEY
jgi:hypothetical protein